MQVMGPDDSYLLQYDPDVRKFWADPSSLALGACFKPTPRSQRVTTVPKQPVTEVRQPLPCTTPSTLIRAHPLLPPLGGSVYSFCHGGAAAPPVGRSRFYGSEGFVTWRQTGLEF